ncbi:unnamed protein product [Nesidiocoris tenuis]|uniref:Nuclease HARBI1 n=1 Tax=Nesidiocoris tenuis TaxID=355587 RepID=A0A6H5GDS3_9HEMI|nr:unnamed protein product [Nesidiocoris tenuis]
MCHAAPQTTMYRHRPSLSVIMASRQQVAAAAYIVIDDILRKNKKKPRWWTKNFYLTREESGGSSLLAELKFQQVSGLYKNFTRMHPSDFEFLLQKIGPKIVRQDTRFRKAICVQDRLAVTLRFLATGDSFTSLQYLFRISKQAISEIVPDVCQAIVDVLLEDYMPAGSHLGIGGGIFARRNGSFTGSSKHFHHSALNGHTSFTIELAQFGSHEITKMVTLVRWSSC